MIVDSWSECLNVVEDSFFFLNFFYGRAKKYRGTPSQVKLRNILECFKNREKLSHKINRILKLNPKLEINIKKLKKQLSEILLKRFPTVFHRLDRFL